MINLSILVVGKSLRRAHYCDDHEKPIPSGTAFVMNEMRKMDQMGITVELAEST